MAALGRQELCTIKIDIRTFPGIECNEHYFYITFMQSHEYLSLGREKTTQKTIQKILRAIEGNPSITREGLAGLLGITPDWIKYHLDNLKKNGLIKRAGGKKEGIWIRPEAESVKGRGSGAK